MKRLVLLTVFLLAACCMVVTAQKQQKVTIAGVVLDADNNPIPNAIIMIDGVNTSSKTDTKGNYKVKTRADAQRIGVFTFGSGIREEDIKGRTNIDIRFSTISAAANTGDEIPRSDQGVNTGYSVSKRKDMTTEISAIDATEKRYSSYRSVAELIEREVAGVKVTNSGFIIQDSKNLQGSIPALLILDGVYVESFSAISPRMVKSVEVLKGTSAAIYGSRGYGGAIIVTTRVSNDN
ncbi:MAG: TonB-dependent receptor plug domain-containing protein [Bacteroidales bacterium]|jgi:TonB-dependent SusC/RagA subfamily outer membrane receptor|nr:TonB-dependent receptor plug domain-containing protein [Bacteroidales bacterium]